DHAAIGRQGAGPDRAALCDAEGIRRARQGGDQAVREASSEWRVANRETTSEDHSLLAIRYSLFAHSTFKFSFLIGVDHLVSSWSISLAYSSGVEVMASPPSAWIRCFTCSFSASARNSLLSRSMMGRGVPAGATRP